MDPGKVLELMRPLVMVIDHMGGVRETHGGCGGFLGHAPNALVGTDLLDLVAPSDRADVASYFVAEPVGSERRALMPLPFRARLLDALRSPQLVDVIPTGRPTDTDTDGWVVVLVPVVMQAGSSRPLDAELTGAGRHEVKQLLAEELQVDTMTQTARYVLVDLPSLEVTVNRSDDFGLRGVIEGAVRAGWMPWRRSDRGTGPVSVPVEDAPEIVGAHLAADGWNSIEAIPVTVHGDVVAVYLRMTRSFDDDTVDGRITNLVDVTQLLYSRWCDQDALSVATSVDPLTGLVNRDTLRTALALREQSVAVICIDIDHFKAVNDEFGRVAGDRVLVEIARRISAACRRDDVVARMGGDEFVVLLRRVDQVIAGRICRRILDEVRLPLSLLDGPRFVSVSIGLAMGNGGGDLLQLADQAMLSAKRQGRARLVLA